MRSRGLGQYRGSPGGVAATPEGQWLTLNFARCAFFAEISKKKADGLNYPAGFKFRFVKIDKKDRRD